ncbi:MAG: 50S ribosomal protein L29 [Candidatus Altiarchaeales archaeon]|nr:MAG: 50S ribosomal protein L29 [Candidatus Altiarchaeales archaeon]RLI95101.1 MAG: 50S ribosomal protein L29 [Candidatus Altiarchaeales archaeon]RLI95481.1 MAG: 50S ribosomal protein L29 [Candidatus Altiarchaeales archaeon]HDO82582.1 50S ribosomal protein L29 [Candidatus Altiarchaeales archaeon]HEX55231.1 50S ribosomal protein L29 [Candidatus Altiarchaeales archaeon]
MAIFHKRELWEMSIEELDEHLLDLKKELMKIRGVLASGGIPEDVGKTREIRKTIARILTIKREKEKKK